MSLYVQVIIKLMWAYTIGKCMSWIRYIKISIIRFVLFFFTFCRHTLGRTVRIVFSLSYTLASWVYTGVLHESRFWGTERKCSFIVAI